MTLPVLKSRTPIVFLCLIFAACAALALLQLKTDKRPLKAALDAPTRVGRETPMYVRLAGTRPSGSPDGASPPNAFPPDATLSDATLPEASLPRPSPLDKAEVEIFALQGQTRQRLRPFWRGAEGSDRAVLAVSLAETSSLCQLY